MLDLVTAYVLTNLKIFPMPAHALIQCFTPYYCLIIPDIKKKKNSHMVVVQQRNYDDSYCEDEIVNGKKVN